MKKIASVSSFISQTREDPGLSIATYVESLGWFNEIAADMFC